MDEERGSPGEGLPETVLPSAMAGQFDLQDFHRGFTLDEITPQNMQSWSYYKHVSAHWPDYVQTSSRPIPPSHNPTALSRGDMFDLNGEFRIGRSYLQSLIDTQAKAFVVLHDDKILAEFYNNGFNIGGSNLLQSASKTLAGVVTHQLIDAGSLAADAMVATILPDFASTTIGDATVQQVLDHMSGARTLLDFHTAGTPDQQWEVEVGLQAGTAKGHRQALRDAVKAAEPGTAWHYSDKNTDTLGLLAEQATGRRFEELLADLFDAFGANDAGSIAVTTDGTTSPCYGISMTIRDYALFHQWVARGQAPPSYYASAMDVAKDQITTTNEVAAGYLPGSTYGSQTYYLPAHNVLHSSGSFGQVAMSDMQNRTVVAVFSDWANNGEAKKFEETRARAVSIINALR